MGQDGKSSSTSERQITLYDFIPSNPKTTLKSEGSTQITSLKSIDPQPVSKKSNLPPNKLFKAKVITAKYPFTCWCGCKRRFSEGTLMWYEEYTDYKGELKKAKLTILCWQKLGYPMFSDPTLSKSYVRC